MAGKRILVVDDEPTVRESLQFMLKMDGHTIEAVESAAAALARFEPGKYAVIVTDNRMPKMSGVQLAQEIRTRSPGQPIILFSGSPPLEQTVHCDLVLLKPFSALEMRQAVLRLANRVEATV